MNIVRSVKLLTLTEEFTEQEKFFISFFDGLKEKTSYDYGGDMIVLYKEIDFRERQINRYYFYYHIKIKKFTVSRREVWNELEEKFDLGYIGINNLIRGVMERVFKTTDFELEREGDDDNEWLDDDF